MKCTHLITIPNNPRIHFLAWDEIEITVDETCEACGEKLGKPKLIYKR